MEKNRTKYVFKKEQRAEDIFPISAMSLMFLLLPSSVMPYDCLGRGEGRVRSVSSTCLALDKGERKGGQQGWKEIATV